MTKELDFALRLDAADDTGEAILKGNVFCIAL